MREEEEPLTGIDRWLDKLSWMRVARHDQLLRSTTERYAIEAKERARIAEEDGYAKGKDGGDRAGFDRGLEQGRQEGRLLERAEQVDAARRREQAEAHRKQQEAAERARWLVADKPIGIDERMAKEIRRDVVVCTGQNARDRQWDMILSNDPATYVVAGAGSGKSTSLVLRVIALNLYRGIDRGRISVFTFTKESRLDFISKLRKRMAQWGQELPLDEARSVVRTFHSMVLRMARASIDSSLQVLELLDKEKAGPIRDIDVDNLLAVGTDHLSDDEASEPVSANGAAAVGAASDDDDRRPPQRERDRFLREAYERAFTRDPGFAPIIAAIYRRSLYQARRSRDEIKDSLFKYIQEHDRALSSAVEKVWSERIAPTGWPATGISRVEAPVQLSGAKKDLFRVHGYIRELDAFVILGGAKHFDGMAVNDEQIGKLINSKRKLLAAYSDRPLIWIDTVDDLAELNTLLTWQRDYLEKRATVPMFKWIAPGDRKRKPVLDTFYELAQFVENLGLPVARTLVLAVEDAHPAQLTEAERLLAQAASRFWPFFEDLLKERGVHTFNQLFAHFSEDHPEHFESVLTPVLGPMQHLLIDEFQDISPQIVKWVHGCQRELVRRGLGGSLTCVGDDWQSIYGWRGSSPDFFVRFKHHFPAVSHGYVKLEENFRSSDHILRCAESVLVDVPGVVWKTCEAMSEEWADEPTPVLVHVAKDKLPYESILKLLASEVKRIGATPEHPVFVLARKAWAYEELKSKSKRTTWGKAVKFMTFHGAKGLEARCVVLLGDCAYESVNPLKNFLYGQAGLGSYDAAQQAEARRLAYVGMTRAMERCYWFAVQEPGGAVASLPLGRPFVAKCDAEGKPTSQAGPAAIARRVG
ncbi:UvrD-helicase domain-containing protein [Paraburkholderia sediminicola]|uniref:UvrD-helicase domain-containing protein n=1 Tax=Paraburkholderia sediminicola TaxID=458836 RepID=UPI0038BACAE5